MKKITTLLAILLISSPALLAATSVTVANINSVITEIYMQAGFLGIIFAILTIIIVSTTDYDLVDSRIRKQKDVLKRRIIFFCFLLLLPIFWFFMIGWNFDANACKLIIYNWDPNAQWLGQRLLSAYKVAGTSILSGCFIVFYVLFAWLFAKFSNRYKSWIVIYSNHKIFGQFSLNKKNK